MLLISHSLMPDGDPTDVHLKLWRLHNRSSQHICEVLKCECWSSRFPWQTCIHSNLCQVCVSLLLFMGLRDVSQEYHDKWLSRSAMISIHHDKEIIQRPSCRTLMEGKDEIPFLLFIYLLSHIFLYLHINDPVFKVFQWFFCLMLTFIASSFHNKTHRTVQYTSYLAVIVFQTSFLLFECILHANQRFVKVLHWLKQKSLSFSQAKYVCSMRASTQ